MKKIHAVLFLSLILLCSACFTSSNMSGKMLMSIQQGMTPLEVCNVFGAEPDFRRFDGNSEEWEYRRYSTSANAGWSIVLIQFTDGRVSGMDSFKDRSMEMNATTVVPPSPTAVATVGAFPNRYPVKEIRVMSDSEFEKFHDKLKFTIMGNEQKKMIERMLQKHDVTSAQCVEMVKEISYTPDQVEIMKKMYPYVKDKQNFNKVINILFSDTYKDEVRKFIKEYYQNNK
ncbi:MAG: DUF4476 domain-containing protein [Bacteroides sp.]|nr:DUF4476 domain-containing protein [Bacteroides sp.]